MTEIIKLDESVLKFDRKNPRLVEFGLREDSTDEEIVRLLWDAMDAREIAMSIVASGYFENDPLIVTSENDGHIVIEGNRTDKGARFIFKRHLPTRP